MSAAEGPVAANVQATARQLVDDERRRRGLPNNRSGRRKAEQAVARRIARHKAMLDSQARVAELYADTAVGRAELEGAYVDEAALWAETGAREESPSPHLSHVDPTLQQADVVAQAVALVDRLLEGCGRGSGKSTTRALVADAVLRADSGPPRFEVVPAMKYTGERAARRGPVPPVPVEWLDTTAFVGFDLEED